MKNALLLNNTHSETEFITILKKYYNKIYTLGNQRPYNKDSKIRHIKLDYRNYKRIKSLKKKYNITDIFPGANDFTLLSLANLRIKHIDSLSVIKTLHNKELFRNFNKDINIYSLRDLKKKYINKLDYPLLAKPKLGHGGKGIIKIDSKKKLNLLLKKIKNNYIIEEFIEGSNH